MVTVTFWTMASHALWVLGCAIVLATLSFRSYDRARRSREKSQEAPDSSWWYSIGGILIGLGIVATTKSWENHAIGGALVSILSTQLIFRLRHQILRLPPLLPRLINDQVLLMGQTCWTTLRSPLFWFLLAATVQGCLYLFMIPPWQHYDEPGHFIYAWRLAYGERILELAPADQEFHSALEDSLKAHKFFRGSSQTDVLGFPSQLRHPPLFYLIASIPIRFAATLGLDLAGQLRMARLLSLLLFVMTIGVAFGLVSELTPIGHPLRWGIPLSLLFLPPFADLMTAMNNDVGAVAVSSLFLWISVRTIRRGLSEARLLALIAFSLLAFGIKHVAAFTVVFIPLVVVLAVWVQHQWSWKWFAILGSVILVGLTFLVFEWGDAASWYRMTGMHLQPSPTRVAHADAPLGSYALQIEAGMKEKETDQRRLIAPLMQHDIWRINGQTITIGGWMWANRTAVVPAPGITHSMVSGEAYTVTTHPITVTTTPTFVSWVFSVPQGIDALHMAFVVDPHPESDSVPLRVFLDGAVITTGVFTGTSPMFDGSDGRSGVWNGVRFTNLVRNGSAEQGMPRFRPWIGQVLANHLNLGWGRTPDSLLASLFDWKRSAEMLALYTNFIPLDGLVNRLAWGQITLQNPMWVYLLRALTVISLVSCLMWFSRKHPGISPGIRPALVMLGIVTALVWLSTATRILPRISEGRLFPMARYSFPVIIPTLLFLGGGWVMLWPRRLRNAAMLLLVLAVLLLNIVSLLTVRAYYAGDS